MYCFYQPFCAVQIVPHTWQPLQSILQWPHLHNFGLEKIVVVDTHICDIGMINTSSLFSILVDLSCHDPVKNGK